MSIADMKFYKLKLAIKSKKKISTCINHFTPDRFVKFCYKNIQNNATAIT